MDLHLECSWLELLPLLCPSPCPFLLLPHRLAMKFAPHLRRVRLTPPSTSESSPATPCLASPLCPPNMSGWKPSHLNSSAPELSNPPALSAPCQMLSSFMHVVQVLLGSLGGSCHSSQGCFVLLAGGKLQDLLLLPAQKKRLQVLV